MTSDALRRFLHQGIRTAWDRLVVLVFAVIIVVIITAAVTAIWTGLVAR